MATYALGDVQGCYLTFEKLLARIAFDPERDKLWLAGDMVNRGPRSLEVLRWLVAHDHCVTAVLGNHDLYLLARAAGVLHPRRKDSLQDILDAPDGRELITWIRQRPILHRDGDWVMVHAGLHPDWSIEEAENRAQAIEAALLAPNFADLLGDVRRRNDNLTDSQRELQLDLAVFTRLRMLRRNNEPEYMFNDSPDNAPEGLRPWFSLPHKRGKVKMVVGHWAALGLRIQEGLVALDSGCVWGNLLSAYRLEDGEIFQEAFCD